MKKNLKSKRAIRMIWSSLLMGIPVLTFAAKDKAGVIMTVDGEDVPTEEFLYLFNKNNQQQVTPQTLDEYLDVFEVYRLKVAEAKRQGVDTTSAFKKEMDIYKRDLVEPYIADTVYFNQLVDIAAQRENELVESSHIMFIRTHDPEKDKRSLEVLDSLRTELLNGADFIELAKNYSEDKFSSDKGGYLGFAPAGTFPYAFETAVYETPEGEISEIVESHVGWHIVKAGNRKNSFDMNRPVKSYEEIKADVARKASSPFDVRYGQLRTNKLNKLKEKHPEVNVEGLSDEETLNVLTEAEEVYQYNTNAEYRNLVDEYVNGSLLFEVSVENIWNKAANDTEGLENFYNTNKGKYTWANPHAKGILIQAKNDSVLAVVKTAIESMPTDSVVPFVKKNYRREATADRFNVEKGTNPTIDYLVFGGEEPAPSGKKNVFTSFAVLEGRIVDNPENLDDVKAAVVNDYQEELEKQWTAQLRKNHQVEVNKKEFARVKKQLK